MSRVAHGSNSNLAPSLLFPSQSYTDIHTQGSGDARPRRAAAGGGDDGRREEEEDEEVTRCCWLFLSHEQGLARDAARWNRRLSCYGGLRGIGGALQTEGPEKRHGGRIFGADVEGCAEGVMRTDVGDRG